MSYKCCIMNIQKIKLVPYYFDTNSDKSHKNTVIKWR